MSTGGSKTTTQYKASPEERRVQQLQADYMEGVLPHMAPVMQAISPMLLERLESPGIPTELEQDWWRTGRERIGQQYGDLSTQISQALAGRGREGGVHERMMRTVGGQEARAVQDLSSQITQAQYDDLWRSIAAGMQYGGAGPMAAPTQRTGTTVQTQEGGDMGAMSALQLGASIGLMLTPAGPLASMFGGGAAGGYMGSF